MSAARRGLLAFLLVWAPYIVSTYRAEVIGDGGIASQALMLLSFLMIWPAAKLLGRGNAFGLRPDRQLPIVFGGTFFLGMLLVIPRCWLGSALGVVQIVRIDPTLPTIAIPMLLLSTFVPSLAEDVLTRGFPLFAWPTRRLAMPLVLLLSAAMYVANHLWRFDWGWTEQARLGAMGLAYAAAAWRTGSLWAAVGLHWGGNLGPLLLGQTVDVAIISADGDRLVYAAINLILAAGFLALPVRRPQRRAEGSSA